MKLLDLKTVKNKENKGATERINRVEKLHLAETSAVKDLNQTRVAVKEEKMRLSKELIDHTAKTSEEKRKLTEEVSALEERKRDALKPIKVQREEADSRIKLADQKEAKVKKYELSLSEREDKLIERNDSLSISEQEVLDIKEDLDKRDADLKNEEESNKLSIRNCNKSWTKLHEETHYMNKYIERKDKLIADQEKANKDYSESLNKKEADLYALKIQLQDERGMLNRAWGELKGNNK